MVFVLIYLQGYMYTPEHVNPVWPGGHLQEKEVEPDVQLPPFWHGEEAQ